MNMADETHDDTPVANSIAPASKPADEPVEMTLRQAVEADIARVEASIEKYTTEARAHIAALRTKLEHQALAEFVDAPLAKVREFFRGLLPHFS
jgi:hypothetical protein